MDILCVGPKPVRQRYSGVIRVQDVRATEIDKVGRAAGGGEWGHASLRRFPLRRSAAGVVRSCDVASLSD